MMIGKWGIILESYFVLLKFKLVLFFWKKKIIWHCFYIKTYSRDVIMIVHPDSRTMFTGTM